MAEENTLRIKQVGGVDQRDGELVRRVPEHRFAGRVVLQRGKIRRADRPARRLPQPGEQNRHIRVGFQTAAVAAGTYRPVKIDAHMPDLPGIAAGVLIQPPAGDDPGADAVADADVQEIIQLPAAAEQLFRERGGVHIVGDPHRQGVPLREQAGDGKIGDAEKGGGAQQHAAVRVERADGRYPDARDRVPARGLHRLVRQPEQLVPQGIRGFRRKGDGAGSEHPQPQVREDHPGGFPRDIQPRHLRRVRRDRQRHRAASDRRAPGRRRLLHHARLDQLAHQVGHRHFGQADLPRDGGTGYAAGGDPLEHQPAVPAFQVGAVDALSCGHAVIRPFAPLLRRIVDIFSFGILTLRMLPLYTILVSKVNLLFGGDADEKGALHRQRHHRRDRIAGGQRAHARDAAGGGFGVHPCRRVCGQRGD